MDLRSYIEERSIPEPNTGCWIWLRSLGSHGYGNARANGVCTVAHRVSHEAFNGPIPSGMLVQHSCDNHWCVAPHHLSVGTDKTNADDRLRRGRTPLRKLTREQAEAIRNSRENQRATAYKFNVSKRTIWMIRQGRIYTEPLPPLSSQPSTDGSDN